MHSWQIFFLNLNTLKIGGKGSTGSIDYNSFNLIKPRDIKKTNEIDYNQFNLQSNSQISQVQQTNSNVSSMKTHKKQPNFQSQLEKMQKIRDLDNSLYGGNGTLRS